MAGTSSGTLYKFNGVLSTDKTVLQNLESMVSAAGSFLSYDIHDSRWSVIINRAGNSVAQFDDSNIIGPINVSSTGLTELYNSVKAEFPHVDLKDNKDYVTLTIPDADRNPNEPDNVLNLQYDIINDPIHAQYLAFVELKQNRLDTVVQFTTDFSYMNMKAGDIIDVTNSVLGYTNKMFRIVAIVENDNDDGSITFDITAMEYDSNVYSTDDLYRYLRTDSTGITTIGALGVPGTPTVDKFERSSRPRVVVESTAPTGRVNGMEFWYTTDVPPAVTLDENRTYTLLSTVRPAVGNLFTFGETVQAEYDGTLANSFIIKTRAINAETAGPFSNTAAVIYTPVQVPDAITDATDVQDASGNSLLSALGTAALLASVNGLFASNTSSGSMFDTIANLLNSEDAITTGVTSVTAGTGISVNASQGAITITNSAPDTGLWQGAHRYVQSTEPGGTITNGDVWFKI